MSWPRAFLVATGLLAAGCSTETARRLAETKASWFELALDGKTVRLEHNAEHSGNDTFRASGPFEPTGRTQLWLSLESRVPRLIPYGSDGAAQQRLRWRVVLGRGTRFYASPTYEFIGEPPANQPGRLRVTKDGMVAEGTFSTTLSRIDSTEQDTVELTDVRFRFYKTRYLDTVGESDLRGGRFVGPVEGVPNLFGPGTPGSGGAVYTSAQVKPSDLVGTWQLYREDQMSRGENRVAGLPPPGTVAEIPSALSEKLHLVYYFDGPDHLVYQAEPIGGAESDTRVPLYYLERIE